jgi:acetolactate synthase I/II/III large subunit
MNGGALVAQSLRRHGVEFLFGLPDTTILGILDAVRAEPSIRYISVRHEQVASMMADGVARATGKPGVCISQCGPGALNLLYGVASAFKDSTPIIAITGNIDSKYVGRDAWHDMDVPALFAPVTKWSTRITDVRDIPAAMDYAFRLAVTGRPGPVHINIPIDLQNKEVTAAVPEPALAGWESKPLEPSQDDIDRAVRALAGAERPVIFAGGGVIWADATDALIAFAEHTGIPVIVTDTARGAIPENHPQALGPSGLFGSPAATKALTEADAIFGVGTRFPDVSTAKWQDINPAATVIQNNTDSGEIGRHVTVAIGIVADARRCLEAMLERWEAMQPRQRADQAARTAALKEAVDAELASALATPPGPHDRIPIQDMVRELDAILDDETIVVMDGGLFQLTAARLPFYRPRSYFASIGLGVMGYGLSAAMGVKLARPDRPVLVVSGDGGFQMVSQDLETAVRAQIPVVVVIYNNNAFAAPRGHQQRSYGGRLIGVNHTNPDFAELAMLYGAEGRTVRTIDELRPAVEELLKSGRVAVVEVHGE